MSKILTFQVVVAVQVVLAVAGFERRVAIFVLQYCHDELLRQEGSKIERTPTQVSTGFVTFTVFLNRVLHVLVAVLRRFLCKI